MDPLRKPFNPNKHLKEEFVSNLTGCSIFEIAALSTIVPALILLRHWNGFDGRQEIEAKKNDNVVVGCQDWRKYLVTLSIDFLCLMLPILLSFTVLAEWAYVCAIFLTLLVFLSILGQRFESSTSSKESGQQTSSLRTSILSYRVSMMIVTCLCILAVDFKIYPRRYAKTETYGTGLMDLGVGSFVLANSLVSKQARNVTSTSLKWKASLQSLSPLIFLGFGRLIFTAGVDYQVHVGEYGVHWNFFFTLAAVSILTSMVNIRPQYCGILGLSVIIGYQLCLICGLNEYLVSNKRGRDIISLNKEGIFSIFGYWGMHLVGIQLGNHLFFGNNSASTMRSFQWARIRVWVLAVLFWSLTIVLDKHVERVSRRMCNVAYVTFVLAQNFQVLAILMLSDLVPGRKTSLLEEAFNRNLLASFLLANVLTGLVNMYVDTLSTSSVVALGILLVYAFVLSVLVGIAELMGMKLKFW